METNAQRYWLEFASRASLKVSVEAKHSAFFEGIRHLPEPWGLGSRPIPPVPDFGGDIDAIYSLKEILGDIVCESHVAYRYRRNLSDDGYSDDDINIILRPARVDVKHLLYTVVPAYIAAFDAYSFACSDEQFIDIEALRPRPNPRHGVYRVGPVSFFDELLCQNAFGLRASEVVGLFTGRIENAAVLHNGAYLIGSSQVQRFEESQKLSKEMHQYLFANRNWHRR